MAADGAESIRDGGLGNKWVVDEEGRRSQKSSGLGNNDIHPLTAHAF